MDVLAVPGRRFLALGDSYTIGEAVGETDRWPAQLARLLGRLRAGINGVCELDVTTAEVGTVACPAA